MGELGGSMGIAELSERADVTPRTIRYYISMGLLPPAGGRGKRQTYGHQHFVRLLLIQRLKDEYLPLEEIRERIDGLSLRDIERLLSTAPPSNRKRDSHEFLESLWREGRRRSDSVHELAPAAESLRFESREAASGRFHSTEESDESPTTLREQVASYAQPSTPSPTGPSSQESWHRVTLDRGVELHYQQSGEERRDNAVQYIIQFAARTLRRASKPGRSSGRDQDQDRAAEGEEGEASTRIHLIERDGRFMRLANDEYESGYWAVSWRSAQRLVGGSIFFHKKQREPSYFGGRILGFRKSDSPKYPGRVIFRFRSGPEFEGVRAGERGWKQERKTVIEKD